MHPISDARSAAAEAERYERLTFREVLAQDLRVMDASAIALARENGIPILVFSIHNAGAFAEVLTGKGKYTVISEQGDDGGRV